MEPAEDDPLVYKQGLKLVQAVWKGEIALNQISACYIDLVFTFIQTLLKDDHILVIMWELMYGHHPCPTPPFHCLQYRFINGKLGEQSYMEAPRSQLWNGHKSGMLRTLSQFGKGVHQCSYKCSKAVMLCMVYRHTAVGSALREGKN